MADADLYDYELPPELIAQQALDRRDAARLLVVRRSDGTLAHRHIRDLPDLLEPGDLVVVNDTRVVPARLIGRRAPFAAVRSRRVISNGIRPCLPGNAAQRRPDRQQARSRPGAGRPIYSSSLGFPSA